MIIDSDGTEHRMHADIVCAEKGDYKQIIYPDGTQYQMNITKHGLDASDDTVLLCTFSVFINHSCDPSGIASRIKKSNECVFTALRDIQPNDEITLDYCLSEYDNRGKISARENQSHSVASFIERQQMLVSN